MLQNVTDDGRVILSEEGFKTKVVNVMQCRVVVCAVAYSAAGRLAMIICQTNTGKLSCVAVHICAKGKRMRGVPWWA